MVQKTCLERMDDLCMCSCGGSHILTRRAAGKTFCYHNPDVLGLSFHPQRNTTQDVLSILPSVFSLPTLVSLHLLSQICCRQFPALSGPNQLHVGREDWEWEGGAGLEHELLAGGDGHGVAWCTWDMLAAVCSLTFVFARLPCSWQVLTSPGDVMSAMFAAFTTVKTKLLSLRLFVVSEANVSAGQSSYHMCTVRMYDVVHRISWYPCLIWHELLLFARTDFR